MTREPQPQRRRAARRLSLLIVLASALPVAGCGGAAPASSAPIEITETANAAAVSNPVAVSPMPGTPDASASTQISFLGAAGTSVSSVRVVGSRSGVHGGKLRAYSTGDGESFVPTHRFTAGERVSVRAQVTVGASAHTATTTFTIAHQAPVAQKEFPTNPGNPKAVQHFLTERFTPSTVAITTPAAPAATPGYLMLAPYQGRGTPGPMIAEQNGSLVWFDALPRGTTATNLEVQSYRGKPVLTWWQGRILQLGFGQGEDVLYDSSYHRVATVRAGNGYRADLHVFHLTPEGTAWVDIFDPIHVPGHTISDSIVQEIDVRTGLVMWEWHGLGHIATRESHNPAPHGTYPWDYAHLNEVSPGSSGDVLVSVRNMWALYDVDIRSGAVRWRLGGTHSSFRLGPGARFYWQHDAEFQPGGLISVFDNGSTPPREKQSRGLLLAPNLATHEVTLVKAFVNPKRTLLAESQGDMRHLPGENWLLGYGRLPNFTEFDAAGHVLLDGTLGRNVQNFRTTLSQWSGHPTAPPAIAAKPAANGQIQVAASWNGATEVSSWRVLAGASRGALAAVASAPRSGFETRVTVPSAGPYVEVQALDAAGAVMGTSATVKA
jgi:Arylsulfotransferase (ASST)